MSIFAITTLGFEDDEEMRRRTVGIFSNLEDAKKVLQKNYGDLNDAGWYPWAVIEEVQFGLYPEKGRVQLFYEYDQSIATYAEEDKCIGWKPIDNIPEQISSYIKSESLLGWFVNIG